MGITQEVCVLAAIAFIWAMTAIKPLRRGWVNLEPGGRALIIVKVSIAILSVGVATVFLLWSDVI